MAAEHVQIIEGRVLDEKLPVSGRFLTSSMSVTSKGAQAMLFDFSKTGKGSAIFVVGGVPPGEWTGSVKPREFSLVGTGGVEAAKARYESRLTSLHAFGAIPSITPVSNDLLFADLVGSAKDLLASESSASTIFRKNLASGISCTEVQLLAPGKGAPRPPSSSLSKSASLPSSSAAMAPTKAANLKPTSASAFFGNAAGGKTKSSVKKFQASSPKVPKNTPLQQGSDEEAEWDGADSDDDKPKVASKPKAVKRAIQIEKTQAKKVSSPKSPAEEKLPLDKPKPAKKAPKVASDSEDEKEPPISGAMDGFLGATEPSKKRMKKVLTEKTYMDDKGYLVTENVWEEVTDDEASAAPASKPSAPKRPFSEPEKKGAAKKAKAPAAAGQKSMMSFFGKK